MRYKINGLPVCVELSGDVVTGNAECLLDGDDNLIAGCSWQHSGFVVAPILDRALFKVLQDGVGRFLIDALAHAGCTLPSSGFSPESYHEYCRDNDAHLKVIDFLRSKAGVRNLPIDYHILDDAVSSICGKKVSCVAPERLAAGFFFIRLVRPLPFRDNNPPHRDAWLERLRDCINLYLPLAGSDENSSLSLVPGSHNWPESSVPRTVQGALVNGVRFSVPSVVMADDELEMIRPRVMYGEGMVFSPYLIHGGAVNLNQARTRVSLEMRFWRCSG